MPVALLCCRYGWLQHDGDGFAVQEMLDREKRVNLTTTFINVRPLQWHLCHQHNPLSQLNHAHCLAVSARGRQR